MITCNPDHALSWPSSCCPALLGLAASEQAPGWSPLQPDLALSEAPGVGPGPGITSGAVLVNCFAFRPGSCKAESYLQFLETVSTFISGEWEEGRPLDPVAGAAPAGVEAGRAAGAQEEPRGTLSWLLGVAPSSVAP